MDDDTMQMLMETDTEHELLLRFVEILQGMYKTILTVMILMLGSHLKQHDILILMEMGLVQKLLLLPVQHRQPTTNYQVI